MPLPDTRRTTIESNKRFRVVEDAGMNVYDVLEKGLDDLSDLCDVVTDKFEAARASFQGQKK